MIPVLYERDKQTFADNGLGGLASALSCVVTEEKNTVGGYYLNMDYPVDGLHFDDIQVERIILASPAPGKAPQPFRVSRITKDGKKASIEASHVSADLQRIVTYGRMRAYTVWGLWSDFRDVARNIGQTCDFTITSNFNLTVAINFWFDTPITMMNLLMGIDGSMLDTIGGEIEFDNWNVKYNTSRGSNTDIEIRYGSNITDMKAETSNANMVTAVVPYFKATQNNTDTYVYGNLCSATNAGDYENLYAVPLDVSGEFTDLPDGTLPTVAQVTEKGRAFIDATSASQLLSSFSVSYTPTPPTLSGVTPAPERNLYLCDKVTVVYPEFGVKAKASVVKTVYDVLLDRYDSITIGTIQRNAADTIAALVRNTGNQKILW